MKYSLNKFNSNMYLFTFSLNREMHRI